MIQSISFAAPAFLLASLLASMPPDPETAADTQAGSEVVAVAALSANPDEDIGLENYVPSRPCQPIFGQEAVLTDSGTGDGEKDTYALPVIGQSCP